MVVFFDFDNTISQCDFGQTEAGTIQWFRQAHPVLAQVPLNELTEIWCDVGARYFNGYTSGLLTYDDYARGQMYDVFSVAGVHLTDVDAMAMWEDCVRQTAKGFALFPDVIDCFSLLRPRCIGVITNSFLPEQAKARVRNTGILEELGVLMTAAEAGARKPNPRIFLAACERLGASPTDCVHVGDNFESDILGAESAGLQAVWLNRESQSEWRHGVNTIASLLELPAVVEDLERCQHQALQ